MHKLQQVVIAAAAVGSLAAIGAGSAQAADYDGYGSGGGRPSNGVSPRYNGDQVHGGAPSGYNEGAGQLQSGVQPQGYGAAPGMYSRGSQPRGHNNSGTSSGYNKGAGQPHINTTLNRAADLVHEELTQEKYVHDRIRIPL